MLVSIAEKLVEDIRPGYAAAAAAQAVLGFLLLPFPASLAVLAAIPFVNEALLRLVMRLAYGPMYVHRVRPLLQKDHPVYGFRLREGIDTTTADFLLFEKYFFRPGAKPSLDLAENKRQRVSFRSNSLGFRGPEFSPRKAPGVVRVFCLGDSTTIGHAVSDAETWPAKLQEGLRARGVDAEVINAGCNGWDSYQELLRLRDEILGYDCDVLVLHQGWNEEFNFSSLDLGAKYRPKVARGYWDKYFLYTNPDEWRPRAFLSLVMLLRFRVKDRVLKKMMSFANPDRWLTLTNPSYLRDWWDNLVEIVELCEAKGVRVFALDYPCLVNAGDTPDERAAVTKGTRMNPDHARYQGLSKARVSAVLRHAADFIPLIDAAAKFRALPAERRRALQSDEIHLVPEGEALFADLVAEGVAAGLKTPGRALKPGATLEAMRARREAVGVNSPELDAAVAAARAELSVRPAKS